MKKKGNLTRDGLHGVSEQSHVKLHLTPVSLMVIKGREHVGTLSVSVHEVFPVNPEFNSILL